MAAIKIGEANVLVAGFGSRLVRPAPSSNLRHVLAVLADITRVLDQLVAELLLDVCIGHRAEVGDAVDDVDREMEAVEPVEDDHVEGRRRRAFLLEAAHMHVVVVGALVGETMDQLGIAVIGEDHRLVAW